MKCLYTIIIGLKGMESFFIKRRRAVKGDEINFLRQFPNQRLHDSDLKVQDALGTNLSMD